MPEITTEKQPLKKTRTSFSARSLKFKQDHFNDIDVRIEIVPLIDVIFCILTFFILGSVGLSRQQAISLDLPKANSGTPQMREMLVVSLDEVGQVYIEKQPVTTNQLYTALKDYHQFNPNGLMVLHAPRNASYNDVIQVLDVLRQVGGNRVALATLPGASSTPQTWPSDSNVNPLSPGTSLPNSYSNQLPSNYPTNPNQGINIPQGNTSNSRIPNVPSAPGTSPSN
jgi:biopolymer transport protein ExbD